MKVRHTGIKALALAAFIYCMSITIALLGESITGQPIGPAIKAGFITAGVYSLMILAFRIK
jgi:hypothetical protein